MITKEINIEGIEQNRFDIMVLLADKSLRGDLFSVVDGEEIGERLHNAVIVEPYPFEFTEQELAELNTEKPAQEDAQGV